MTGAMMMMMGAIRGVVTGTATVADTKAGANALANINLRTDGTISYAGSGSSGPPQWWLGAGAAPVVYCTNTVNSGSNPTTGATPLTPTSGTALWQWVTAGVGTVSATCTVRMYYDAAGTQLAGQIDYTVTCIRSS